MEDKLKEEQKIFLQMKESYPEIMKDIDFEKMLLNSIQYIEFQLEDNYIDMTNGDLNEMSFVIIVESLKLYKEKHNIN